MKIIYALLAFLGVSFIFYLGGAFIAMDFDPFNWHWTGRLFYASCVLCVAVACIAYLNE